LAILPTGSLASGSDDKKIKIWNTLNGANLNTLSGHTGSVNTLVLIPDGTLASGSSDKTIKIWKQY